MWDSDKITTAKINKIEQWCRTVAFKVTKPMNIMAPHNYKNTLLDSLDHAKLRYLAQYFNRCTKVSMQAYLVGKSTNQLIEIINNRITMIRNGEANLMLPFEYQDYITAEVMAARVGKGKNKEFIKLIEDTSKILINSWSVRLPDSVKTGKALDGSELIIYATKNSHTRYFISPKLEGYFADLTTTELRHLTTEERANMYNITEMHALIRGGNDSHTTESLQALRDYIESLLKDNKDLSLDKIPLPANKHIGHYLYSAAPHEAVFISKQIAPYILYNYCCPRSKLQDGERFITNTEICRVLGLEKIRDNYAAIQQLLGERRVKEPNEEVTISVDGVDKQVKISDAIRKLSAKRIEPSYFVHREALGHVITRDDVVRRRSEIKQRETRQLE